MNEELLKKLNKKRAKRNKENKRKIENTKPQTNIGTKQVIQVEEEEYIFQTTEDIIIRNVENKKNGSFLGTAVIIIAGVLLASQIMQQNIPSIPFNNGSSIQEDEKIAKSSQRDKFLEILEGELGKTNGLKYSNGVQEEWCADFITWGKNQAGIANNIIPDFKYCGVPVQFYKEKDRWHDRGDYTPKVGDIVIFNWSYTAEQYDHVGVIKEVYQDGDTTKIKVINGNPKVTISTYDITDSRIIGYGSPEYVKDIVFNKEQKLRNDEIILDFNKENYKYIVNNKDDEREI